MSKHVTGCEELCGFIIDDQQYAISVKDVQEVVRKQNSTTIPKAPPYVYGLINLRGQIITAISLRRLFGLSFDATKPHMNIIVRKGDALYSLVVDRIMDVINVDPKDFEETPGTLDANVRSYVKGVYKLQNSLLMHIDISEVLAQ